ncbi:SDR family oxidoreductase [Halorhabdus sp. BNX81]|uniref:SDR family oxidoreductase n=1 Tax=Halorhabdus sp. BNX81 TaxID=2980181 RepID=UPI0023DCFCE9|nr:SDR family oxidoreductase [Halorhabdus sp. BNX81]WEL22147.1 Short-chain alcohol dehydrogenase [Halorhabdus sp. BNX81]
MEDHIALITGCSSGIGRASAERFLEEDWTVYATARDTDDIADLADAGAKTAALDVTNARAVERVVDRIIDEEGRIDCLVNNAGTGQFGPIEDVPTDALEDQFDVNLYGPHRLIRAVLPHMREQAEGTIVNVSSLQGRLAVPGMGAYAASKFALEAMSDSLRAEVDSHGVDVVVVEPGVVETSFADRTDASRERLEQSGAYDGIYEAQDDRRAIEYDGVFGIPPADVATVIYDAAAMTDPDPRYAVGNGAKLILALRYLPDHWRDAAFGLFQRVAGLGR